MRHAHVGHGAGVYAPSADVAELAVCERCGARTTLDPRFAQRLREAVEPAVGFVPRFDHTPLAGLCGRCAERLGLAWGAGHASSLPVFGLPIVFAACTAISMAVASTTFGLVLGREAVARHASALIPAGGVVSLAFGMWYARGALEAVPYVL